jgi:hypothetical protein
MKSIPKYITSYLGTGFLTHLIAQHWVRLARIHSASKKMLVPHFRSKSKSNVGLKIDTPGLESNVCSSEEKGWGGVEFSRQGFAAKILIL